MKAEPNTRECPHCTEVRRKEWLDPEWRRKTLEASTGPRHGSTGKQDDLALMFPHVGYSRGSDPSM